MAWMIAGGIVVFISLLILFSAFKAGSDADDQMLGDRQYYE